MWYALLLFAIPKPCREDEDRDLYTLTYGFRGSGSPHRIRKATTRWFYAVTDFAATAIWTWTHRDQVPPIPPSPSTPFIDIQRRSRHRFHVFKLNVLEVVDEIIDHQTTPSGKVLFLVQFAPKYDEERDEDVSTPPEWIELSCLFVRLNKFQKPIPNTLFITYAEQNGLRVPEHPHQLNSQYVLSGAEA